MVSDGAPTELKAAAADRRVRFTLDDEPGAGLDRLTGVTVVEVHSRTATLRTTDARPRCVRYSVPWTGPRISRSAALASRTPCSP